MEPHHARVHRSHDLSRAASVAHALSERCIETRSLVLDVLSVDVRHRHVMNEKCDVLATSTIPSHVKRITELISEAREMHAAC